MGFAIPLQQLFHGSVVWRGMVYTVLMVLGKCATGVWLYALPALNKLISKFRKPSSQSNGKTQSEKTAMQNPAKPIHPSTQLYPASEATSNPLTSADAAIQSISRLDQRDTISTLLTDKEVQDGILATIATPQRTLYAALLLSFAMTIRGEIGFLIAAVGQSIDILAPEDVYLVVIWAVIMCTLLGSIGVGIMVNIIKKASAREEGATRLLGIWA